MKVSRTLQVLLTATLLLIAVGIIWWIVGISLGKVILSETGGGVAFRAAFGFKDAEVLHLFLLSLLAVLVPLLAGDGAGRWIRLAGVAGVAALLAGGGDADKLTVALFVFAVAAANEGGGKDALITAAIAGAVVALAAVLGTGLTMGQKLIVIVVRDAFFYFPLLVGASFLEKWIWKRVE
jgi:hypothetical protein